MIELSSSRLAGTSPRGGDGAERPRRILRCQSIDSKLKEVLEIPLAVGRVHSIYRRVVNIECDTCGLFTLAGSGFVNAPNTAIVEIAELSSCGITTNDRVVAVQEGLRIGTGVVLDWQAASLWQAYLPLYANADGNLQARLHLAQSYLARHGSKGSFVSPDPSGNAFKRHIGIALQERSGALLEALERMQTLSAGQHAKSLIGLGPGLTPAGDDFLVGLFAVLNLRNSPCYGWLAGDKDLLLHASQSTNAISYSILSAAAEGRVSHLLSRLIKRLIGGTPETPVESLDHVLSIGSTSGSDLVAGILAGLNLNLRITYN